MTELVDSLLTLARADEGRAPLHLEEADLREILAELAETASILGEQASVDVAVQVPNAPVRMNIDASRVRQLLMNLLTNAIKYTPHEGSVDVASKVEDQNVVITVRDHVITHDIIHLIRDLFPDASIVARGRYHVHFLELIYAGAHEVVDEDTEIAARLATSARRLAGSEAEAGG